MPASSTLERSRKRKEAELEQAQGALFERLEQEIGFPKGSIRLNGLAFTDTDMTMEEWIKYGRAIGMADRWAPFAIGDWLLFGEALFGHESAQGIESTQAERLDVVARVTGKKQATIQNYARVCERVALARRHFALGIRHHDAVAMLDPDDQVEWLNRASDEGWSSDDLRQAIRDHFHPAPPGDSAGGQVLPAVGEGISRGELVEQAAALVYHQAQIDGPEARVPAEAIHQLGAALGQEG